VAASDTSGNARDLDTQKQDGQDGEPKTPERKGLPWSFSGSYSYSESQFGPSRSTLNMNSSISLTRAWRIAYTTSYNIEGREFLGQNYTIHRDLHCWQMSFTRQKLGDEWEFYFRINVIAHPEIYTEQGQRGLRGGGGFSSPF
jgi:hypothetical protein